MRKINPQSLLPALLCGAALLAFGCNRGEESHAGQVEKPAPVQIAQTPTPAPAPAPAPPPRIDEIQTPQTVQVRPETPAPSPEKSGLDARERALAAREAELDAREQRLRQPKAQAPAASRPAPRPPVEEAAPAPAPVPETTAAEPSPSFEPAPAPEPVREEPRTVAVTVPAGTRLEVELTRTLASNTSSPGDAFRARVSEDVMQDGLVAIPRGSEILGEVTEAVPLKKIGGQARLALKLTDLVLPSGKTVPVEASFIQEGRNENGRAAATIGGAAAGGAILGRILGKGDRTRGGIVGAILGAAAGTAIASKTPGEEVVIPEGSVVPLQLDDAVQVRVRAR
jgi:type IV secretory pathway VirB10-like protein